MKAQKQDNRQRILEAANRLFYTQGYNQTSFSEIADAAGIPRGNFYYYFKSKDDILAAVIDDRLQGINALLAEWDKEFSTPRERLQRFVTMLSYVKDDAVRYGCPIGSLNVELSKTQLAMQAKTKEMFDIFVSWLTIQFISLGQRKASHKLALHLLARMQGISLVANAYADPDFLQKEVAELHKWVEAL